MPQTPKPPSTPHTTFPLPPELRLQILTHLLTTPSRLAFSQQTPPSNFTLIWQFITLSFLGRAWVALLNILLHNRFWDREWNRQCILYRMWNRPWISVKKSQTVFNNLDLAGRFNVLCLVSRQTRREAREVFFERNLWALEICLQKGESGEICARLNSIDLMRSRWGDDVIGRLRDVRLYLVGNERATFPAMSEPLHKLVRLWNGGNLRRLVVDWSAEPHQRYSRGKILLRQPKYGWVKRKEDGKRDSSMSYQRWIFAQVERTIEPLCNSQLPLLERVSVTGCVTDAWAEWLEEAIKADVVSEPQFVCPTGADRRVSAPSNFGLYDGFFYQSAVRHGLVEPGVPIFRGFLEAESRKPWGSTEKNVLVQLLDSLYVS